MKQIPIGEMNYQEKDSVGWLTFPAFERLSFLHHAFSTRLGGVSSGEFSSMNLSFGRGDPRETVEENYRRFCSAAGFPFESLTASAQDHHTVVRRVSASERGVGITRPRDRESVDGLITNDPAVTLVTYYADCTPLFFADPVHRAVGLGHSGWRGTVAGMGACMVRRMAVEFGTRPEDLLVAIGPSIGACCYEVDEVVRQEFAQQEELDPDSFFYRAPEGKYRLDLWEANRRILMQAGVLPEHISTAGICTRCNSRLLWSHRATGGRRGGLAAFLRVLSEEEEHGD